MILRKLLFSASMIGIIGIFGACDKDDDNGIMQGTARLEITDSPLDDPGVSGTFVTISDIQIDGESLEGFNKTTIDLMAYQRGETKLLGEFNMDARSYSEIKMILDFETDENGDSPGCYVYDDSDQAKHPLTSNSNEVTSSHDFTIESEVESTLVVDFDLRKCIKRENNSTDRYDFATQSEMESGIRVVNKSEAGTVEGECDDQVSNSDEIIVYAYAMGSYNQETETNGQGESNIMFANATTSSSVDANGMYELHFLEEGEYELHFCSYNENDNGEMELNGTFTLDILGNVNKETVTVNSASTVELDVDLMGILDIL